MVGRMVKTACTRDCPSACALMAEVEGGRIVRLLPEPQHAITGRHLCVKAPHMLEQVYGKDRITSPLYRVGNDWQPLSWDDALNLVAERIRHNVAAFGPLSILHYQGSGSLGAVKMLNRRFFNLLGGVTVAGGTLCGGAGRWAQVEDMGVYSGHDPLDLENSRFIILWGINPSATTPHLRTLIKRARERGVRVVLIDPAHTESVDWCSEHIAPKPGSDRFLALAMAKVMLDRGLRDDGFLKAGTVGLDGFLAVAGRYSLRTLARKCGCPESVITDLATSYATRSPAAIVMGFGVQRYRLGAATVRYVDALGALSGNLGRSGGGVSRGRDELAYFDRTTEGGVGVGYRRAIPKPLLGQELPRLKRPPVNMVFINGANPAAQSPDARAVCQALSDVEFTVVIDRVMTDTARLADVFLPTTTFLEEFDVIASFWHTWLSLVVPVIRPVGNSKPDLEIFQALADRLGLGHGMEGSAQKWISRILEPLSPLGVTEERLAQGPMRRPRAASVPFHGARFATRDGRFHFVDTMPRGSKPDKEFPLRLLSTATREWMHSQVPSAAQDGLREVRVHPSVAKKAGAKEGDEVWLVSRVGRLKVRVVPDSRQRKDVALAHHGGWAAQGACVNVVVEPVMSAEGECAAYYETVVRLEPVLDSDGDEA